MADINIQFHATAEEIAQLMRDAVRKDAVYLVAMSFQPFNVRHCEEPDIESVTGDVSIDRLCVLTEASDLQVTSKNDFDHRYRDQLVVDVGHLTPNGLSQSWLACRTENVEALMKWRRIVRALIGRTRSGVTCINRENGTSDVVASFRYTDGAKQMELSGVKMLPPQGHQGPVLRLGRDFD